MNSRHRLWQVWLVFLLGTGLVIAATPRETREYEAAVNDFKMGFWERADQKFGAFVQENPLSDLRLEAILWQAQARLKLSNHDGAIALLQTNLEQSAGLRDRYLYWLGEARLQKGDYAAAARDFAGLIESHPFSSRRLDAALGAATAWFKLGQWERVIARLTRPEGVFQEALKATPNNDLVIRGLLLLGEAYLEQQQSAAVHAVLDQLNNRLLPPELAWRKQYLLVRTQREMGELEAALASTTNLLAQAVLAGQPNQRAESFVAQAELLDKMGRQNEAVAAYENNLQQDVSEDRRRQALMRIIELRLARHEPDLAAAQLNRFLTNYPADPVADLALLTLGEVLLKSYRTSTTNAAAAAETNALEQARNYFLRIANDYPESSHVPMARLNLGWCYWEDGRYAAARESFAAAAETLQSPYERALARFKLADSQFKLEQYAEAVTNYQTVVERFQSEPEVEQRLLEQALYQIVRAGVEANNMTAISAAVEHLLEHYPNGFFTDRSLLLAGREINDRGNPAEARRLFRTFETNLPDSTLLPDVRLAIARTFEREGNWAEAVARYAAWREQFPADHPDAPRALYNQALASFKGGAESDAFNLFTDLLATFPDSQFAPMAQFWVGDHHFRKGHYADAELSYQIVFQRWKSHELALVARMMAGRAAYARFAWSDAREYFLELIRLGEMADRPHDLLAQAYCALGDTLYRKWLEDAGAGSDDEFAQAIASYRYVVQNFPTNSIASRARGSIGNAYQQRGDRDPTAYNDALAAYEQVLESPHADIGARSVASIGMGAVMEKMAARVTGTQRQELLKKARDRYLDVVDGSLLREGETVERFHYELAGLEAARLTESLGEWTQALRLYEQMSAELPPLRPILEEKISRVRERKPPRG